MSLLYASQASAVDWVELQLDTEYHAPGYYQPFYGKYTATEDIDLKLSYGVNGLDCYLDEAMTMSAGMTWNNNYPATYALKATAGTTYYIVINSSSADPSYSLKIEAQKPFGIESISPAEGSAITSVNGGDILIRFNAVPAGINYARIGTKEGFGSTKWNPETKKGYLACTYQLVGTTMSVDYSAALKQMAEEGNLKPGDEVTIAIRLKQPDGNFWLGNSNGIHKMNFVFGGAQAECKNEIVPEKILSWMEPDNNPESTYGKLILEFDKNLSKDIAPEQVRFAYGNIDSTDLDNEYTEINLPFTVDGGKLTVDFTGVSRRRIELLPNSKTQYNDFTVKVMAIKDEDGVFVSSPGAGTVGSFSYLIPYEELEPLEITHEFTPESGSSLNGEETLNLWINNTDKFSFDGVRFDFKNEDGDRQSIVVPMSEIKNNSSEKDELDLDIPVPEAVWMNATDITVTLNNLKTQDGCDHSNDVRARYDAFMILSVDPEAGSTLEKLAKGSFVTITENLSASYPNLYLKYRVVDNNPTSPDQAVLLDSWMNKQPDGSWNFEVFYDVDLFMGHTYTLEVRAWEDELSSRGNQYYEPEPMSSDFITWKGAAEPFRFSSFQFDGITPSTDTKLVTTKMNKFTLKFDGLVNLPQDECYILMGRGQHGAFESLVAVDPNEDGLSSTWVATVAESFMETLADYLNMSFKAYDIDGRVVEGNMGEEKYSYFYFQYEVSYNVPVFDITPGDGEEVDEISSFRLGFAEGIAPSWTCPEKIKLVSKTETIREFTEEDFSYEVGTVISSTGKEDQVNVAMIVTLPTPVTAPGVYKFMVPEKYLNLGQEEATRFNGYQEVTITIPEKEEAFKFPFEWEVSPKEGEVESFLPKASAGTARVTISIPNENSYRTLYRLVLNGEAPAGSALYHNGEKVADLTFKLRSPQLGIFFDGTFEEPGEYQFVIVPKVMLYQVMEGTVYTNPDYYDQTIILNFRIGPAPEVDPLDEFLVTEPSHKEAQSKINEIKLTWHKETEVGLGLGKATLTIGNARSTVYLPDAYPDEVEWNVVHQPLDKEYSDVGSYTINYPEGYFTLGPDAKPEKAFSMTYAIGTVGVNNIFGDSKEVYNVYDFNGVQILKNGDVNAVKALPSGYYIINGKKYVFSK